MADAVELERHLENLKASIMSIKPAGADGFEGLIQFALTRLTDIPFRLSASGLQGGIDGEAAFQSDAVCFEAKRYSDDIPRNEVLVKIADLSRNKSASDRLWIFGATVEVNAQLAAAVKEDGDNKAVSTLILDWTGTSLPLLAIAVVAAGKEAVEFIFRNQSTKTKKKKFSYQELETTFTFVSKHPQFPSHLQKLKSEISVSNLALKRTIELNIEWRKQAFSSKRESRNRIGQGVAVLEDHGLPQIREELRRNIARV